MENQFGDDLLVLNVRRVAGWVAGGWDDGVECHCSPGEKLGHLWS